MFRILISGGSGYSFNEQSKALAEELTQDCQVHFLQGDYYLADATQNSLEQLSASRKNFFLSTDS